MELFQTFDHPNIVRYLEVYEDQNYYFIVCECLKGSDCIDAVWRNGAHSEDYAAAIIKQILEATVYIHSKGLAHNQLFPINILHVAPGSLEVKVIDLDEASNQPIKDMNVFLRHGDYRGCYIAPETIKGQWNIKNDEWAVGVTMYYLLKGWVPFYDYDTPSTFKLITNYEFDRESYEFTRISEEGKDLMLKLMAYKPEDRISASDALKHPWFLKAKKGELKSADLSDALNSLKKYHAGSRLKQAVQSYLTQTLLSQDELNNIAKMFKEFDTNGNGVLSRDELVNAYRTIRGINFSE